MFYENETGGARKKFRGEVSKPEEPRADVKFLRRANKPPLNHLWIWGML